MEARYFPDRLQGTPEAPAFSINGWSYNMVINEDLNVTWTLKKPVTYEVVNQLWTYLKVQFADDLNWTTAVVAEWEFPVVNAGTENEYFGGIIPASELNKLTSDKWYIVRIITSTNERFSYCPFYILGGV